MGEARMLDALDLDNIEAAARGRSRGLPCRFSHPDDTLLLVALVRRLETENARLRERVAELSGVLNAIDEGMWCERRSWITATVNTWSTGAPTSGSSKRPG